MKLVVTTIAALLSLVNAVSIDDQVPLFVEEPSRELRAEAGITAVQGADLAVSAFTIGQAIVPAITGSGKKCHQLACWVGTRSEACGMAGANQVQRELTRGRNSFAVESVGESGMWVRYWRTMFWPPDRGDIAIGNCTDGNEFRVSNCQESGKVHC